MFLTNANLKFFIRNLGGFILICTSVLFTIALMLHLNVRLVLVLFVSIKKGHQAPFLLKPKFLCHRFCSLLRKFRITPHRIGDRVV